jgi:hypothetical protein
MQSMQSLVRFGAAITVAIAIAERGGAQPPPDTNTRAATQRGTVDSVRSAPRRYPFWPDSVPGPPARPGAILPGKRIVAYYGNPLSTRMGILGQIPPAQMLARLETVAAEWAKADSTVGVQPALELIATVAQLNPQRDGTYRLRIPESTIEQVYSWAHERGWILILDIQVGRSDVAQEIEPLRKFLVRPDVHLAIDPEFDMKPHQFPGKQVGTTDAGDINYAIAVLGNMVNVHSLPPKILVVHRYTKNMVTRASEIALDPRVQVIMHMDGWGPPSNKLSTHRNYIEREPVQWVGFKLFYKNDKPMMSIADVLRVRPIPLFITYQ